MDGQLKVRLMASTATQSSTKDLMMNALEERHWKDHESVMSKIEDEIIQLIMKIKKNGLV